MKMYAARVGQENVDWLTKNPRGPKIGHDAGNGDVALNEHDLKELLDLPEHYDGSAINDEHGLRLYICGDPYRIKEYNIRTYQPGDELEADYVDYTRD
jgi:hypothetical protein